MNKKMKALLDRINGLLASASAHMEKGETDQAATDMDTADELQKQFEVEERIYERQKQNVPRQPAPLDDGEGLDGVGTEKGFDGFGILAKCLRGFPLTQDEQSHITIEDPAAKAEVQKAMVSGGSSVNGENFLIPEDVDRTIRELRRNFQSAKDLVTIIPTTVLTGAFTWEKGQPVGLISFEDGADVPDGKEPSFVTVKYAISFKGAILCISNILTAVEAAGLTAYLNRWFVKSAIISENSDIFEALKAGKTAAELSGLDSLKDSMELDLDPDSLIDGIIVTNQTGFNRMGKEKDATGHSYLQPDPANTTRKLFNGLPIRVFSDAQLPNAEGKAPVFYGDTKSGIYFMEFRYLFFASSNHAGFRKNQTLMRVIEGYDVIEADKSAYCYGLLAAPTPPAVQTSADGQPVADPVDGGATGGQPGE